MRPYRDLFRPYGDPLTSIGTDIEDPCYFWKHHEAQFPTLAALARDIFSIPATGVGVERLFSSARDICHYRRGSLNATTIQDLMMLRCMTQFDANNTKIQLSTQSEDPVERMEVDEAAEGQLPEYDITAISDDEGDIQIDIEVDVDGISEQGESDDRMSNHPDQNEVQDQEIDSAELPPQPIVRIVQSDSQRPHRERKRRRDEAEYEYSTQSRRRI